MVDMTTSSSNTSEALSDKNRIDRIISNNIKPYFPAIAKQLVERYWHPTLTSIAEKKGIESIAWREAVRLLNNLSLYLNPSTKQHYPKVEATLLPDLVEAMKATMAEQDLLDSDADRAITAILNTEIVSKAAASQEVTSQQLTSDNTDETVLDFDIKPDDLPSKDTIEKAEFDRGNTVEFESFPTSDEQKEKPIKPDGSMLEHSSSSELEFDIEPLEIDIANQETQTMETEQAPEEESKPTIARALSAEELPPLELDLSDLEDDDLSK